jgi:hypothetical protein
MIVEILNKGKMLNLNEKHFQHSYKISTASKLQAERSGLRFPAEAALLWAPSGFLFSDDGITSKILSFND